MAERFYVSFPLQAGPVELTGPEAHHLAVVCRVRPGVVVYLFNGDGNQYRAAVVAAGRKVVQLVIDAVEAPQRELGFRLEAGLPLPKGDRADFLIEKLTELGVTAFTPLRTTRSVVHPREAKLERLQRQVVEASKQCGRNVLMEVRPLCDWEDFVRRSELPARRLLAHPGSGMLTESAPGLAQGNTVFAVGPEGGFTDEELTVARAAEWQAIDLGPRILRVETAALALATLLSTRDQAAAPATLPGTRPPTESDRADHAESP